MFSLLSFVTRISDKSSRELENSFELGCGINSFCDIIFQVLLQILVIVSYFNALWTTLDVSRRLSPSFIRSMIVVVPNYQVYQLNSIVKKRHKNNKKIFTMIYFLLSCLFTFILICIPIFVI